MEKEKRLEEMSTQELVYMLISHPEMEDEIIGAVENLSEFYDLMSDELVPNGQITDDSDLFHNMRVEEILKKLNTYLHEELYYDDWEQYDETKILSEQMSEFFSTLHEDIAYGYTPDELREYCELHGYNLDELYPPETLQEAYREHGYEYDIKNNTVTRIAKESPKVSKELLAWLNRKEEKLLSEEKTKKTIDEAKALLAKQVKKTGEQK